MTNLYTVQEVSKILKVNKNKVYEFIDTKELKATRIGSLKIKEEWLEEFIESRTELVNADSVLKTNFFVFSRKIS